MPPARTGVAVYSEEVVPALQREHEVDVYVDEPVVARRKASSFIRSAHDFVWRHQLQPYDLTVFQLGNSSAHDYQWPYLFRYPGLVVLHDVHLHHARASALLRLRRAADYRAELAANHPGSGIDVAELAVAGFDSHLYYSRPMTRLVTLASRLTAVHSPLMAETLRAETGRFVETIRMSHGIELPDAAIDDAAKRVRARHGLPEDSIVFGLFGGLTPEKRVPQVLAAFAALRPYVSHARLLLAGEPVAYSDARIMVNDLGIQDQVVVTGYVNDAAAFDEYIAACDISVNLRWPTAREVSGPWLRALAAGRPTITTDLAHTADLPALDPRTWSLPDGREPITVSIDIVDEDHSLRLAMRRLATDAELRQRLGRAAAAYWRREHSMERMVEDYGRVLDCAVGAPLPTPDLPAHLRANTTGHLHELLAPFGLGPDVWSKI